MLIVMTLCVGTTASLTLLIPYQLANVSECTKGPVLSLIWSGVLQSIIACFFDICELISFSVKCYHTGGIFSVTSSSDDGTECIGDCLLLDDARLACYTTLLPRCGYLDSFVMSRSEDYVKTALALMLMLLIGFALQLIQGAVPLEFGRWWFIVVVFSCGVAVFACIICIHSQTGQTSSVGESLLADATDARVWRLYFNFVFNSAINLTETRQGHCTIGLMRFLGYIRVAAVIVLVVVFSLDVKCLSRFNVVFVVNISVIFVTACVIFGYVSNWTVKVNGVGGSLIPFGWTRISADVALCFWVLSALLLRWNLQEYNLIVKHRPGRDNILPDLLSRVSCYTFFLLRGRYVASACFVSLPMSVDYSFRRLAVYSPHRSALKFVAVTDDHRRRSAFSVCFQCMTMHLSINFWRPRLLCLALWSVKMSRICRSTSWSVCVN